MKHILFIICLFIFTTSTQAAFLVNQPQAANTNLIESQSSSVMQQNTTEYKQIATSNAVKQDKDKKQKRNYDRSQLVALLLCVFVGPLGIHRFYLDYYTIGIIQLLTLGGFGIWWLIDLVRILTGSLTPRKGNWSDTL